MIQTNIVPVLLVTLLSLCKGVGSTSNSSDIRENVFDCPDEREKKCYVEEKSMYICVDRYSTCPDGNCHTLESYCKGEDGELACINYNRHCSDDNFTTSLPPSSKQLECEVLGRGTAKYCEGQGCVSILQDCRCNSILDEYCAFYDRCIDMFDHCPGTSCAGFECTDHSDCVYYGDKCNDICNCDDCSDEDDCDIDSGPKDYKKELIIVMGVIITLLAVCVTIYSKAKQNEDDGNSSSVSARRETHSNNTRYAVVRAQPARVMTRQQAINQALQNNSTERLNNSDDVEVNIENNDVPSRQDEPPSYEDIMNTPPIRRPTAPYPHPNPQKQNAPAPPPSYDAAVNL